MTTSRCRHVTTARWLKPTIWPSLGHNLLDLFMQLTISAAQCVYLIPRHIGVLAKLTDLSRPGPLLGPLLYFSISARPLSAASVLSAHVRNIFLNISASTAAKWRCIYRPSPIEALTWRGVRSTVDAPLYDELQATSPPSSSFLTYMVGKEPGALLYFKHNSKAERLHRDYCCLIRPRAVGFG